MYRQNIPIKAHKSLIVNEVIIEENAEISGN